MLEKIIFALTFIFGVIALLGQTKLFEIRIGGFFDTVLPTKIKPWLKYLDVLIFLFSLSYQLIYWLY